MLLNLLVLAVLVGVVYVLATLVAAATPGLSLPFASAFVVGVLSILVLLALLLELFARREASVTLSQQTGVGADLTFATYYQYYASQLRRGMTRAEVRARMKGFARVEEVRRGNELIELYTYRFGIIGRPLLEVWYDASERFDHIEEGR